MKTSLQNFQGRKVFVYFNLHKNVWSVRDHKTRKVIAHTKFIALEKPVFKVTESGRQRVLTEKQKNVHAGVVGFLSLDSKETSLCKRVSYNPYKYGYFYDCDNQQPVFSGEHALLKIDGQGKSKVLVGV